MKYIILFYILLTGCTTFIEHNSKTAFPSDTSMHIEIRKLTGGDLNTLAYAELYPDNKCIIYLRNYPKCLAHEVRHCYEGNWHKDRKTDEEC